MLAERCQEDLLITTLSIRVDVGEMSAAAEKDDKIKVVQRCASCGIAGGDDIKLKDCSACHLVRYCSVKCQRDHRPKHKRECKKRAAELKDELLFKQPESSHFGDCPICFLPLPIDESESVLMSCCGKRICKGCHYANQIREYEGRLQHKCAFCRKAVPKTIEEADEQTMKRVEVNDPSAMSQMGISRYNEGDYSAALDYLTKAAELGDALAHYQLSIMYLSGKGVEKDEKRALHHTEQAAIGGQPNARHNLGCMEKANGRMDRAGKHWIIAAKLGYDDSLGNVKVLYQAGYVSKEDFAAALRGHHDAIEATKSPQREEAAEYDRLLAEH